MNTKAGSLGSLWAAWDRNADGNISRAELRQANITMDLDGNNETSLLEIEAYFAVNRYLICRPLRNETFLRLNASMLAM